MYVVIIYNRYDSDDIDVVCGPFSSLAEAQEWDSTNVDHSTYRKTITHKLRTELEDWMK